ncbi:hypothetical protein [Tunturiibacter gelidoferens]|jgi:hypothetical protein|uniref:Uncharacterized protein n=1 Tax=Tunturiibacter gelidiferens TaxID=3069689 RepID=A0A9X0U366_9BACT|nr:hypothetical protein [Edaphobacter lichenicola]MBB5328086.1 hypothetical protein [Edaphobacter lichenicola]
MKKPIKVALFATGLVVLLIVLIPQLYVSYEDYSIRHQGEALAKKIEIFERREGHVPTTLQEIGEKDPHHAGPLSYYAIDADHYSISYMDWASATYVFNSSSHKWEFRRS